jgi:hypothetical protein
MKKPEEHIRVNLGQSPFIFDIDGMMSVSSPDSSSGYVLSATSRESPVPLSIASSVTLVGESGAGHEAFGEMPHEYVSFSKTASKVLGVAFKNSIYSTMNYSVFLCLDVTIQC